MSKRPWPNHDMVGGSSGIRAISRIVLAVTIGGALAGCFAAPPQIIALDPNRGTTSVDADSPVRVTFDRAVDQASLVGRFRVDPPLPGCDPREAFTASMGAPCSVRWLTSPPGFIFEHRGAVFAPATRYQFTVAAGVRDGLGSTNGLDHRWDLTAAPAPRVRAISPSDGATGAATDIPPTVTFDRAMSAVTTASDIHLSPAAGDTRVVRDPRDHSRFLVLPGRLLDAATTYRLTVGSQATDEHGEPVIAPSLVTFVTGGPGGTRHAVVIARRGGEVASSVVLADAATPIGATPSTATVLEAPRCVAASCGPVPTGAPLVAYTTVALSKGSRWLAIGEVDRITGTPRVRVLDLTRGVVRTVIDNAGLPGWSADGARLAVATPTGSILIFDADDGATTSLPGAVPLVSSPLWTPDGSLLVLAVRDPGGAYHIDLANPSLEARYPLPQVGPGATAPVLAPGGGQIAYRQDTANGGFSTWVADLGSRVAPRQLADAVTPLGYADDDAVVGVRRVPASPTGLVRLGLGGGDVIAIEHGPGASDLDSVAVTAVTRRIAYLAADAAGVVQAWGENSDGTGATPLTDFTLGTRDAVAVAFGG